MAAESSNKWFGTAAPDAREKKPLPASWEILGQSSDGRTIVIDKNNKKVEFIEEKQGQNSKTS